MMQRGYHIIIQTLSIISKTKTNLKVIYRINIFMPVKKHLE